MGKRQERLQAVGSGHSDMSGSVSPLDATGALQRRFGLPVPEWNQGRIAIPPQEGAGPHYWRGAPSAVFDRENQRVVMAFAIGNPLARDEMGLLLLLSQEMDFILISNILYIPYGKKTYNLW